MKTFFYLLLLTSFSLSTSAQTKAKSGPLFKFQKTTHNFGNILEGPDATYTFKFKNTGKAPLVIQKCSASCGCTTPAWTKDPIMPGKTGAIKVKFATAKRRGTFTKKIYIKSNAVNTTNPFELTIKGTVIHPEHAKTNKAMKPSKQ